MTLRRACTVGNKGEKLGDCPAKNFGPPPLTYHAVANLRREAQERELALGVASLATAQLGVVMALLSVVQGGLCSLREFAVILDLGGVDGGGARSRSSVLAHVFGLTFDDREVVLLSDAGDLGNGVEGRSVHLEVWWLEGVSYGCECCERDAVVWNYSERVSLAQGWK